MKKVKDMTRTVQYSKLSQEQLHKIIFTTALTELLQQKGEDECSNMIALVKVIFSKELNDFTNELTGQSITQKTFKGCSYEIGT